MKVLNRIKKNVEFNKVIEEGQLVKSDSLTLYFLKNSLGFTSTLNESGKLDLGVVIAKQAIHKKDKTNVHNVIRYLFIYILFNVKLLFYSIITSLIKF